MAVMARHTYLLTCHAWLTGIVTPTKYEVYGQSANWDATNKFGVDGLCRITMQLSTLYQNWSGTHARLSYGMGMPPRTERETS